MKKFLRIAAIIIVGIFIASSVISVAGAANTVPGEITNEELRTLFNENQALLQDIATQLIPLREAVGLYRIQKVDSRIEAYDGSIEPISLEASLLLKLEQYFDIIGAVNYPAVLVYEVARGAVDEFIIVEFNFNLDRETGHNKGIKYAPEAQAGENGDERLAERWYIYEWIMPGPPLYWYQSLPAWLQWILRYVCFGWVWMD